MINKLYFFILMVSLNAYSAMDCQNVFLDDSHSEYSLKASFQKGLHFQFDDDVMLIMLSNEKLWTVKKSANYKNHIWLVPKNQIDGSENTVGLTAVLSKDISVNFVIEQNKTASGCAFVNSSRINSLMIESNEVYTSPSVSEQFDDYQNSIQSNYSWDSDLVSSVHDDGIFMYVKLKDLAGMRAFSVVSVVNDVNNVVSNLKYSDKTNTYKLPGLHDYLIFNDGEYSFEVKRK